MRTTRHKNGTTLKQLVAAMERIAPPDLAEEWDNTGLILGPARGVRIRRALLTIDCTDSVVTEAIRGKCQCVVAYHPPLFEPVNRLTPTQAADRRLIRLLESRIAVYSPHTALDMAAGGVNDWLAEGVMDGRPGRVESIPYGPGRLVTLQKGIPLKTMTDRVKRFLKVPYLRIARPEGKARPIRKLAVCAGAGFSALEGTNADVYLTGEMKHHDLLATVARGVTVILSEHTHTERGYLPVLKKRLGRELNGKVDIRLARTDRDPVSLLS